MLVQRGATQRGRAPKTAPQKISPCSPTPVWKRATGLKLDVSVYAPASAAPRCIANCWKQHFPSPWCFQSQYTAIIEREEITINLGGGLLLMIADGNPHLMIISALFG